MVFWGLRLWVNGPLKVGASSERFIVDRAPPCMGVTDLVGVRKVLKWALDNRLGDHFPSSSVYPGTLLAT